MSSASIFMFQTSVNMNVHPWYTPDIDKYNQSVTQKNKNTKETRKDK